MGRGSHSWARLSQAQTALRMFTRTQLAPGRNVPKAKHTVSIDVGALSRLPEPRAIV